MHAQVFQKNIYLCDGVISSYMLVTLRGSTHPAPKPPNPPLPETTTANTPFPETSYTPSSPHPTSPHPTRPHLSITRLRPPLTDTPNSIARPVHPDHDPTTTLPKNPKTWYPSPFHYQISKTLTPPLSYSPYHVDISYVYSLQGWHKYTKWQFNIDCVFSSKTSYGLYPHFTFATFNYIVKTYSIFGHNLIRRKIPSWPKY